MTCGVPVSTVILVVLFVATAKGLSTYLDVLNKCAGDTSTNEHANLPKWSRSYYKLCTDPRQGVQCMADEWNHEMVESVQVLASIFCSEFLPKGSDLEAEAADKSSDEDCKTLDLEKTFESCRSETKEKLQLKDIMFASEAKKIEICSDNVIKLFSCLRQKLEKCGENTAKFEYWFSSLIGGKCLAKHKVLNPIVTMRVCSGARIPTPSLLVGLAACALIWFYAR